MIDFATPMIQKFMSLACMLLLYIFLPTGVSAFLFRILFQIKGELFKFLIGIIILLGIYFFFTDGIPRFMLN